MLRRRYLVATIWLAALAAPLPAQSVKAGTDAWTSGDYTTAVAIWRPLAEKGDADAQFNMAQAYRFGRGVSLNLATAQTWYERAADKGHAMAQYILGRMLFMNGNHTGGVRWIKMAAEQGEPAAMLAFGTALFNGDGVPQNPVLGYAYVSRAAAKGIPEAKDTLAQLDDIMTVEDRKKGVAIALAQGNAPRASAKTPAKSAPKATAAKKPPAKAVASATMPTKATAPPKAAPKKTTAAAPATGGWRIQLGAFSQRSSAEALFGKLSGKSALAGRQAFYVRAGAVTRLQVGPFESRSAADAACRALGQACFPVAAR
ncbi:MAG TPA: SPOR domain-containing protein [Sphingomicrobium sp.]|nr:SPOR domain-containing protein [Sphingomicrobium sp.]